MKKFFVTMLLMLALAVAPVAFSQDAPVGVQSNQQGSTVYFSVYNDSASTVCVFPYVAQQSNVYGSVVPMIQLGPGEQHVNIGAYAQADPQQAWSVQVAAKYRAGTCA
jgi:hypothetical protein